MATANDVVYYLIYLRDLDKRSGSYYSLDTIKLQKLVYYCQGAHYKWDDARLVVDDYDKFEAFDYGPKLRWIDVHFGRSVTMDMRSLEDSVMYTSWYFEHRLTDDERATIESVWNQLKNRASFTLVESSCLEMPYVWAMECGTRMIADDSIREYFRTTRVLGEGKRDEWRD